MAQTAFAKVKDAVFSRLMRAYRPIRRVLDASVPAAGKVRVRLRTGTVRFVGTDAAGPIRVEAAVRARSAEIAQTFRIVTAQEDGAVSIEFDGTFTLDGRTCASLDVLVVVPRGVAIDAKSDLGPICAIDVDSAVEIRCSLGNADVSLSDRWSGDAIRISSNLGGVVLRVPGGLRLKLAALTSLGKTKLEVPSYDDAPEASVHSNLGNVNVIAR